MNNHAPAATSPKAAEMKSVLMILDQVEGTGPSIDRMKVSALPFWGQMRVSRLAKGLDRVFVRLRRATPVLGDSDWRLEVILETARREGRDMAWLGDKLSELYVFRRTARAALLALALLAPLAAHAGPGCGGLTGPIAVPMSPFGALLLQEEASGAETAYVRRDAIVEKFEAAAKSGLEAKKLEGRWRRVLALREGEALAPYAPGGLDLKGIGQDLPVAVAFLAGPSRDMDGPAPIRTPFGGGYAPGDSKELRGMEASGVLLDGDAPGLRPLREVSASGSSVKGIRTEGPLSYEVECRLVGAEDLLCRVSRTKVLVRGEMAARVVRVEYFGFTTDMAALRNGIRGR